MAQQVFAQWHPVAKALDEENNEIYIPFAGIHAQTRDGKDEVIFGAGAMVWDPGAGENGMWVPVDAASPMEVRVRQLEAQIAALQQFLEGRLNADLADVLARLNVDLSTRASEQTLVQARDALSALAGTVDAGAQKVTLSGSIVSEATLLNNATGITTGTSFNVAGLTVVAFEVSGTFNARVVFEASIDGSTWHSLPVASVINDMIGPRIEAAGVYRATVSSLKFVRARIDSYTSGSVTVRAVASNSSPVYSPVRSVHTVLERAIRSATTNPINVRVPSGARVANVQVRVYGVTGTFAAGQGLSLVSGIIGPGGLTTSPRINGSKQTSIGVITHLWGVDTLGDAVNGSLELKTSGVMVGGQLQLQLGITGTFQDGEGFDCAMMVHFFG